MFISHRLLAPALAVACLTTSALASVVTVDPSNMQDWAFNSNDPLGNVIPADANHIGALVVGPATPPLGIGSAELKITGGNGDGSEQLRNTDYDGVKLSALTSLSYSTYTVTNNGQQFPYLALYISTQGNGTYDDKIYFEPPYQTPATGNPSLPNQGPTVLDTWQSWDALDGAWWDDNGNFNPGAGPNGVNSLAAYMALYPNATIVNPGGGLGGVRFAVGYSSPGDNYEGYVDDFTIGTAAGTTTYDFEPATVPEPASLSVLGLGAAAILRRRRKA